MSETPSMKIATNACVVAAFVLAASSTSFADQVVCEKIAKKADKEQAFFSPPGGYKVVGEGRLYFHVAPHDNCITKDVFVVPGDSLTAITEYKGWYSVYYVNPKTGKDYDGWLDSKRLQFTGTMGPKD